MAGFDFYYRYRAPEPSPLARALLAKSQRLCRAYDLELHYMQQPGNHRFYVTVDGPLKMMQALYPVLVKALTNFSEGANEPTSKRGRVAMARALSKEYWHGVVQMTQTIYGVSAFIGGTPNSFLFEETANSDLDERIWSFSMTLFAYENGEITPAQMVEDTHTTIEWLMNSILRGEAKGLSYAQCVDRIRDRGDLSAELADDIIKMKNLRVGGKHKNKCVKREACNEVLHSCVEATHTLLKLT